MKKLLMILLMGLISYAKYTAQTKNGSLHDAAYELVQVLSDKTQAPILKPGQVLLEFDKSFRSTKQSKVVIDTTDFVPMELESTPELKTDKNQNHYLAITIKPEAAEKMKSFTAKRVMKEVVIVIKGKALSAYKIREAISGNQLEITGGSKKTCEDLLLKLKKDVKE